MNFSKNVYHNFLIVLIFLTLLFLSCNKSSDLPEGTNKIHVFNEIAYFSRSTVDGGFIVLSSQFIIKSLDVNTDNVITNVTKINADGEKSWTINFESYRSSYNYFYPKTVNAIKSGGFIIIAQYGITNPTPRHLMMIKIDANGNVISTNEIPPNGSWVGPNFDITQTADDNFVLSDGSKIYKLNQSGNLLWLYSNARIESYLLPTQDGGILICNGHGADSCSRQKLDNIGDLVWQKDENIDRNVWKQTSIKDINGNDFVIAGSNMSPTNLDFYLGTYSSIGDSIQFIQVPAQLNEYCHAVQPTQDGGYLIIGTTTQSVDSDNGILYDEEVFPDFNASLVAIKLDAQLNVTWKKNYSGNYGSEGLCINESPGGGYLLLGNQVSYSNPNVVNMIILKINNDGDLQ